MITFEGTPLVFHKNDGRPCLIVADAGRALGYASDGKNLAEVVRKQWAEEMIEGKDFAILEGDDLRQFKALAALTEGPSVSANARSLMVLYESGWDLVCVKTDKPAGKRLRRFIVDKVLPTLRREAPASTALALPAPPPVAALAPPTAPDTAALLAGLTTALQAVLAPAFTSLHERLDAIEVRQQRAAIESGLVTSEQVEILKHEVRDLAALWLALGWARTLKASGTQILKDVYGLVDWGNGERRVHLIPAHAYGRVLGRLARLRWEARQAERRQTARAA